MYKWHTHRRNCCNDDVPEDSATKNSLITGIIQFEWLRSPNSLSSFWYHCQSTSLSSVRYKITVYIVSAIAISISLVSHFSFFRLALVVALYCYCHDVAYVPWHGIACTRSMRREQKCVGGGERGSEKSETDRKKERKKANELSRVCVCVCDVYIKIHTHRYNVHNTCQSSDEISL